MIFKVLPHISRVNGFVNEHAAWKIEPLNDFVFLCAKYFSKQSYNSDLKRFLNIKGLELR
jgi:hypothetical protein